MNQRKKDNLKKTISQLMVGTGVFSGAVLLTCCLGYGMYLLMGGLRVT